MLGDQFWPRALAGKRVWLPIQLDIVHTYHYISDVAAGLVTLGCGDDGVYGRPWMLPCAPATSTRDVVSRLASVLGSPVTLGTVPRWVVKLMGTAVPLIREVGEMLYQWQEPFVINDRRFRQRFRQNPEDADTAAAATVAWASEHYG